MLASRVPVMIFSKTTKREKGHRVQLSNIQAAKTVADIIRTCLGPKAMMKMLLDPASGIVMTNDGNAILREIQVQHPAAKALIEISRTQDEEVGDGTTSVVIIAAEILSVMETFLEQNMHPSILIAACRRLLDDIMSSMDGTCIKVDVSDRNQVLKIVGSCLATKFFSEWGDLACKIAVDAVRLVERKENDRHEIDIKRYVRVEKVPGGMISDSYVLNGIMLNKDVLHDKMRRRIEKPRILLLDCPLEYKKGESQTSMELTKETDFTRALEIEEEAIKEMCDNIIKFKPDLVLTEKGVSDLAIHFLMRANISVIRRIKKTDNDRIARATGATIVSETSEIKESDIGTKCGLFEIRKLADDEYAFIEKCTDPHACTIVLRGASKDVLDEVMRNLQDALCVARNILLDPYIVPGGGAFEMYLARQMHLKAESGYIKNVEKFPYNAAARALEVIPRLLIQNSGADVLRQLTLLRAKVAESKECCFGIDGDTGNVINVVEANIVEPRLVKMQTIKSAFETAIMILRIDDIVSGSKKASTLYDDKAKEQKENVEKDQAAD